MTIWSIFLILIVIVTIAVSIGVSSKKTEQNTKIKQISQENMKIKNNNKEHNTDN